MGELDAVKGVRRARRDEPRGRRPFHVRGHRLRAVVAKLVRMRARVRVVLMAGVKVRVRVRGRVGWGVRGRVFGVGC